MEELKYKYFIKCRVKIYSNYILQKKYVVESILDYPLSLITALQKAQNKIIRSVDIDMYHYIIPFLYEICELESSEVVTFEYVIGRNKIIDNGENNN